MGNFWLSWPNRPTKPGVRKRYVGDDPLGWRKMTVAELLYEENGIVDKASFMNAEDQVRFREAGYGRFTKYLYVKSNSYRYQDPSKIKSMVSGFIYESNACKECLGRC